MKTTDEAQKRLKLDVETLRHLQSELENVVGADGDCPWSVSIVNYECNCKAANRK